MKIEIYTDGSCTNNGKPDSYGAFGFVILIDGKYFYEYSEFFIGITNNQMELLAPTKALEYLIENNLDGEIIIYSDSQYVINGITSWVEKWKKNKWMKSLKHPVKNKEYWIELDNLYNSFKIKPLFKWVRGHNNDEWNCYIDELCSTTVENNNGISFESLKY